MTTSLSSSTDSVSSIQASALAVGFYGDGTLTASAQTLNDQLDGQIASLLDAGKVNLKAATCTTLLNTDGIQADRLILVCCGDKAPISEKAYRAAISKAIAEGRAGEKLAIALADIEISGRDAGWAARALAIQALETSYRFNECKSESEDESLSLIAMIDAEQASAFKLGQATAQGVAMARDLGNRPGNVCTPTHLAEQAESLSAAYKSLSVEVLDQPELEELGMGSFLSVAKGSREAPKLIVMQYQGGNDDDQPIALVGKGITFDSGGISLKPGAAMDEMKFDMCGAASVFGTMRAVCELELPINVVGIVPSCENLPDGQANKPGDIVTSMAGQTIEVLNTDAEGRLILCDALTYGERFNPSMTVDIATLTGACVIALGKHASGLFSNDDDLADALLAAGNQSGDRAWRMPLWDEYGEQLKSNFADVGNIGGRDAGAITAAAFLSRFTKNQRWAHLDIAGTAWKSGGEKGATGRPVALLVEFLRSQAEA